MLLDLGHPFQVIHLLIPTRTFTCRINIGKNAKRKYRVGALRHADLEIQRSVMLGH